MTMSIVLSPDPPEVDYYSHHDYVVILPGLLMVIYRLTTRRETKSRARAVIETWIAVSSVLSEGGLM